MSDETERVALHDAANPQIYSISYIVAEIRPGEFGAYAATIGRTPGLVTPVCYSRSRTRAVTYALAEMAELLEAAE